MAVSYEFVSIKNAQGPPYWTQYPKCEEVAEWDLHAECSDSTAGIVRLVFLYIFAGSCSCHSTLSPALL